MLKEVLPRLNKQILFSATKCFSVITIPLVALVIVGNQLDRKFEYARWQQSQTEQVAMIKTEIASYLYHAITDLLILADNNKLFAFDDASKNKLADDFLRLARISHSYHQLRFIDTTGQEIVRVNFENGIAERVPEEQLQNKKHRPYFVSAMKLDAGEVFISRMDLNIEHNRIEVPHRPVIRFAAPVYDNKGKQTGVLVLNYLGEKVLHKLDVHKSNKDGRVLLVNEQGYYLYSDIEEDRWGGQLDNRPAFADGFSEWNKIVNVHSGSFPGTHHLVTHETIDRLDKKETDWLAAFTPFATVNLIFEEKPWRIISLVDNKVLYAGSTKRLYFALQALLFVSILLIPFSVAWARARVHKKELIKRNRVFTQVVEQSKELIYITKPDGSIIYANPAIEEHTGYSKKEILGNKPSMFKSGVQPDDYYQQMWKNLKRGDAFEGIFVNRCKDGKLFYEAKIITPLLDKQENISMYVSTGRDISLQRGLYNEDMDVSSRIATSLSHHFGNLLNSISGFSQLIALSHEKHTPTSNYAEQIIDSSNKAEKLLRDIRMIANEGEGGNEPIDINRLLQQRLEGIISRLTCKSQVLLHLEGSVPPVACNAEAILVAIEELLENACEAIDGNGAVHLGLKRTSIINTPCETCGEPLNRDYVELYVYDTGEGIPADIQQSIWAPFFSTRETASLVAISPGLGLTTVRSIVHSNGGHILMDSSPGKGTSIRLLFPPVSS